MRVMKAFGIVIKINEHIYILFKLFFPRGENPKELLTFVYRVPSLCSVWQIMQHISSLAKEKLRENYLHRIRLFTGQYLSTSQQKT